MQVLIFIFERNFLKIKSMRKNGFEWEKRKRKIICREREKERKKRKRIMVGISLRRQEIKI